MSADFFIRRPVFSTVCSLIIILAGAVSIPTLPVAQYPQLAPPQVTVRATYTGASAEVVESTVTTPLEQAINGVQGLRYVTSSSSSDGISQIVATFELERNLDLAAVDVSNRVSTVLARLPSEVTSSGVTVTKNVTGFVLAFGLFAEKGEYSNLFLSNYADVYLVNELKRIPGVGEVRVFGERKYAMRVWLDPARLASRDLTASDVIDALREQNVQIAAGRVGQPPAPEGQQFQISVRATGRLVEPREFANIILKTGKDGTLVQLKDVGRVELGAENYDTLLRVNGVEGVGIGVQQLATANALDVEQQAREVMARLAERFPPGLRYAIAFNPTDIVRGSINEVLHTLLEAIALVILVIFVFLQSWRGTLIPAITVPVSLIGTFAFVKLFGFSINTLTLFGITLATGLVVDDAIVVIENIERHIAELREGAREASSRATGEVFGAVIATSIVLVAVFVPVAFFPGTTGRLYNQFALTIAFSIAISAFNALTLTPALSAILLKRGHGAPRGPFRLFNWGLERLTNGYLRSLGPVFRFRALGVAAFVGALALTWWAYQAVPRAWLPQEDLGYFITSVQAPQGASLDFTSGVVGKVEQILREDPQVAFTFAVIGFSFAGNAPNRALVFSTLKPIDQRRAADQRAEAVIGRARGPLAGITEAIVVPFAPPPIQGVGSFGGFQFYVQDQSGGEPEGLADAAYAIVGQGNQQPELRGLFTAFTANDPQFLVAVDREKAKSLGVPIDEVAAALQVYMGSQYVNDFAFNNRSYRVYVQADRQFRSQPKDIQQFYVRADNGRIMPLANLVQLAERTGPQTVTHYNLFRAAEINGSTAPGYSSGQAIAAMERLAREVLPQGFAFEWSGLSREEIEAGAKALVIFGLGVLFVFLVLAAQYESFALPFIIMLAVPVAVLGALGAQSLRGLPNDVYVQIGLVMLVGLATKNAILIVEFAEKRREQGVSPADAVREAARLRLRPILMTSLAFILGLLPLVFASGAGAVSRQSLGTAVAGGMVVSTALNLYFIPLLYVVLQGVRERVTGGPASRPPAADRPAPAPAGDGRYQPAHARRRPE
jgi:hydrophobic/amphiphilic exporter-1 (mainly G- bacteria), HAE1 family